MNIFHKFIASLQLREAIKKAEDAHCRFGHRYYVMPTFNGSGKLVIMDRKNFRGLKQKHYINQAARVSDLRNECFYFTPDRSGNYLSAADRVRKRRQFFEWVQADRKARKQRKRKKK